jgi:excisionase family DNA binding protein
LTKSGIEPFEVHIVDSLIQKLRARNSLISVAEVSKLLGFHPVTIRDWSRAGRLPAMRIAGQWRFDPGALAAWVDERKMG